MSLQLQVAGSTSQTGTIEEQDENVQSTGREVKKRTKRLQTTDSLEEEATGSSVVVPTTSIPASELFRHEFRLLWCGVLEHLDSGAHGNKQCHADWVSSWHSQ